MPARVFIASTCFDLIDLRAELEQDIREMGLLPVLSDNKLSDFDYADAAVGRHSIDVCLQNLRSSQYAIFVWSQRYGHDLTAYGYKNISATQLEYMTALSHNEQTEDESKKIRIIVYVRDRTMADYDRWRKTNRKFDKNVILYVKDAALLSCIEHHDNKNAAIKDRTNYITQFTSSVDLKLAVRKQLIKEAMKEELAKLMLSGIEIPTFIFNFAVDQGTILKTDYLSRQTYNNISLSNCFMVINMSITGTTHQPHSIRICCDGKTTFTCFLVNGTPHYRLTQSVDKPQLAQYKVMLIDHDPDRKRVEELERCERAVAIAVEFTMSNGYILRDHWKIVTSYVAMFEQYHFHCEYLGKQLIEKGRIFNPPDDYRLG